MDGMIVNGKSYSGGSAFSHVVGENQTISVLDTGTSLASVPPSYAEAIYKDLPGAELVDGAWVVPCDTKVNISFVFGKDVIPIDPIDATFVHPDGSGGASCIGSFIGVDSSQEGSDFVLGDSFLRNAYALYDFGIWATPGDSNPFIQLLAATDASKAWAQFDTVNAARLAAYGVSLNTTGAKSGLYCCLCYLPRCSFLIALFLYLPRLQRWLNKRCCRSHRVLGRLVYKFRAPQEQLHRHWSTRRRYRFSGGPVPSSSEEG
ncbi:hypothetical protein JAAARDRAFT_338901 [Jaapia argillacea MUCL 33604]|uniref:Peptidase A1 domain-containing protein n=1 Tax=Jaapia argillacea MUCL 33604 TaxID=933084 RepID=A0A067PKV8_9AGAM|nr:hypothetical protein JAAARDRAFT_338901 [Jaapia argillacea MUCL 33604]